MPVEQEEPTMIAATTLAALASRISKSLNMGLL